MNMETSLFESEHPQVQTEQSGILVRRHNERQKGRPTCH